MGNTTPENYILRLAIGICPATPDSSRPSVSLTSLPSYPARLRLALTVASEWVNPTASDSHIRKPQTMRRMYNKATSRDGADGIEEQSPRRNSQ